MVRTSFSKLISRFSFTMPGSSAVNTSSFSVSTISTFGTQPTGSVIGNVSKPKSGPKRRRSLFWASVSSRSMAKSGVGMSLVIFLSSMLQGIRSPSWIRGSPVCCTVRVVLAMRRRRPAQSFSRLRRLTGAGPWRVAWSSVSGGRSCLTVRFHRRGAPPKQTENPLDRRPRRVSIAMAPVPRQCARLAGSAGDRYDQAMIALQDLYPDDFAHCYGCGRLNAHGLHVRTEWQEGEGIARYQPASFHIALPGFVYGG